MSTHVEHALMQSHQLRKPSIGTVPLHATPKDRQACLTVTLTRRSGSTGTCTSFYPVQIVAHLCRNLGDPRSSRKNSSIYRIPHSW